MNYNTQNIIKKLKSEGLIANESDLTAGDKTNIIFDYMIKNYSYLLSNDKEIIFPEGSFEKGKFFHELIVNFGKYFLSNPQVIENKEKILESDKELFSDDMNYRNNVSNNSILTNEPVIFIANHRFKDDVLSTIIAANKRAYIIFGSLPQFYGTIDGILSAKNGVIMVNRKIPESRKTSVEKAKYVLNNGINLIIFPEGVWNKKPCDPTLEFWNGFYKTARKEDGSFYKIVPIIHYIKETHTKGKDNPIHTIIDNPISLDGMEESDAIEYVRTRMNTWYWKLMELYGVTNRENLLKDYSDYTEAWENELRNRVATADKYDYDIEISADRIRKDDLTRERLNVWNPIAELEITGENAGHVIEAKKMVKQLKRNDFQHRF